MKGGRKEGGRKRRRGGGKKQKEGGGKGRWLNWRERSK